MLEPLVSTAKDMLILAILPEGEIRHGKSYQLKNLNHGSTEILKNCMFVLNHVNCSNW